VTGLKTTRLHLVFEIPGSSHLRWEICVECFMHFRHMQKQCLWQVTDK